MKVLSVHDLKPEDSLRLDFEEGAFDSQAAWESELEPFLQALEAYADGWMPDVVEGKRCRKYTRPSFWKAQEEERNGNGTSLGLYRTKWPALDMTLHLPFPPLPSKLGVSIKVQPLSLFADTERCRKFVEMVRAWASYYPVTHAAAHSVADRGLADSPLFGRDMQTSIRDGFDKIYEIFWLNVFGPKLVETVGRERMLSTPAWRVEELPNGCILLVTWPIAADFASEEARLAQARADVADPQRALEHYSYLAELLVALLHTKVPSVFKATPESLTDVDYQFLHESFPRVFEREHIDAHAVPAIGAYLGEVLIRHLGGRWIPRQKLEEAQVLVGGRVWFPFARAWRYMRSCQSLLDASLTQLYRVAERHRG